MKKVIVILLIATLACKNEPNTTEKVQPIEVVEDTAKELKIAMNFKTDKADEFRLMLNNVEVDEFQRKNIHIIEKVAPTSGSDEMTASFGANNISKTLHINLGNKEEKSIEISAVQISYGQNSLAVDGSNLSEYFSMNKYVDFDSVSQTIKTKRIDGKHIPTIILKRKHINSLMQ
ncbi:MAG: hypothetical protein KJO41_09425 [Bacteroidia bacterium]|nr:hypothetical protein [Bacteroidia bacterium]NNK59747.1 hypothetical protein [Flavobacteriaceae bacterium]RZW55610.1 MAG: hypothetical protein EX263_04025 [Flavobacteriaceae bacterium]